MCVHSDVPVLGAIQATLFIQAPSNFTCELPLVGQGTFLIFKSLDWRSKGCSVLQSPCTYPCFPRVFCTSAPQNILSKPPATFPHKYCRNNCQQCELAERILLQYHQKSLEKICTAEDQSNNHLFSSPACYCQSYWRFEIERVWKEFLHCLSIILEIWRELTVYSKGGRY